MDQGGLVASAACYSLVLQSGTLHLIRTGPAWRLVKPALFSGWLIKKVVERHTRKIKAGEALIPDTDEGLLAAADASTPAAQVERFDLGHDPVWDRMHLTLGLAAPSERVLRLRVEFEDQRAAVSEIAEELRRLGAPL